MNFAAYSGPPASAQQATMSMASRSGKSLLGNPYNPIEADQQQQQQQKALTQMQRQPPASLSSQQVHFHHQETFWSEICHSIFYAI